MVLLASSLAAGETFRPVQSDDAPFGRYLVGLAGSVPDERVADVSTELARAFGGRLEPYAATGFHGFAVVMRPARARQLSEDPRVTFVGEIAPVATQGGTTGRTATRQVVPPIRPVPTIASATLRTEPLSVHQIKATSSVAEPWSGTYLYDAAGNIKAIGENRYVYDGVSRLRQATAITSTQSNAQHYNYDAFGNLLTVSTDGTPITLTVAVDPHTNHMDASCPPEVPCLVGAFDEAGNQVSSNGSTTYLYDTASMMSESHAGAHELFVYDASDQRVATVDYSGATVQTWHYTLRDLGENVVRDVDDASVNGAHSFTWRKDYVHRAGALLASAAPGPFSIGERHTHFHLDHLGTPRLTTDQLGRKAAMHTYWAFGVEAAGSDSDSESRKFTGHERDVSSDGNSLDYIHARFYSSSAARFTAVDPGDDTATKQPQTWNKYVYVRNNPIGSTDPTGRHTYSLAASYGMQGFLLTGVSGGINFDLHGNVSITTTESAGFGTPAGGPSLSFGYSSKNDTVHDLEGRGGAIGGSLPVSKIIAVGVEVGFDKDGTQNGGSFSIGTPPGEIHIAAQETKERWSINIPAAIRDVVTAIPRYIDGRISAMTAAGVAAHPPASKTPEKQDPGDCVQPGLIGAKLKK